MTRVRAPGPTIGMAALDDNSSSRSIAARWRRRDRERLHATERVVTPQEAGGRPPPLKPSSLPKVAGPSDPRTR